jgi:hypothetical protein
MSISPSPMTIRSTKASAIFRLSSVGKGNGARQFSALANHRDDAREESPVRNGQDHLRAAQMNAGCCF